MDTARPIVAVLHRCSVLNLKFLFFYFIKAHKLATLFSLKLFGGLGLFSRVGGEEKQVFFGREPKIESVGNQSRRILKGALMGINCQSPNLLVSLQYATRCLFEYCVFQFHILMITDVK